MKKGCLFSTITVIMVLLIVFQVIRLMRQGTTDKAVLKYGESQKFSQAEIQAAMDCVMHEFRKFEGCELLRLTYDEDFSNEKIKQELEGYKEDGREPLIGLDEERAIVLSCDFRTGPNDRLEPNTVYEDFTWDLVKNEKTGRWEIKSSGYH